MSWWQWLLLLDALAFVPTYRTVFRNLYDTGEDDKDPWSREGSSILAAFIGLFGALILPFMICYKVFTPVTERDRREREARLNKELYELERASEPGKAFDQWLERKLRDFSSDYNYSSHHSKRQEAMDRFKVELTTKIREGGLE